MCAFYRAFDSFQGLDTCMGDVEGDEQTHLTMSQSIAN